MLANDPRYLQTKAILLHTLGPGNSKLFFQVYSLFSQRQYSGPIDSTSLGILPLDSFGQ